MRNRLPYHSCIVMLAVTASAGTAAQPEARFAIGREDVVTIRAETAWEDILPGVVHFSGGFEMRVRNWRLVAERATVRGPLDDPDAVELSGAPARLDLLSADAGGTDEVEASAERIVYRREGRLVVLEGDARVTQGDSVLRSSRIEYEPETDQLRASGDAGVRIQVPGAD